MKPARRRVDVNLDELDRVLDGARQAPLSEADYLRVDTVHQGDLEGVKGVYSLR